MTTNPKRSSLWALRWIRLARNVFAGILFAALWALPATPSPAQTNSSRLFSMNLRELMDIPVTIIGSPVTVAKTPAAVAVVTQEDIRRSGAMSIPEALRLVPGLEVAQLDASQWAVTARGFNDVFANKLLVLQDGRSIYTPLFSGVFWDVQGTMMEDIERIEVVRGPGATLWGANAVNGVINIITKNSRETQGLLVSGGAGTQYRGFGSVRYGDRIGDNASFRVFGTYLNHEDTLLPSGDDGNNGWQLGRIGFRTDWDVGGQKENALMLEGDAYVGWIDQTFGVFDPSGPPFSGTINDEYLVNGAHLLGRWTRTFSETSDLQVQTYFDRNERDERIFHEIRNTFDLSLQHRFAWGERHLMVWGLGYRVTSDEEESNPTLGFNPEDRTVHLFSAFAQDEIGLLKDQAGENLLALTLGSKFEHNDHTGFEVQPGARLVWTPWKRHAFWSSVSRAVRTPSRAEDDIVLTQVTPLGPTTIYGSRNFRSEELMAYEIGYRAQPLARFSFDIAAFYNEYDHLRSIEPGGSPTQPVTLPTFPLHAANKLHGETYGIEASAVWIVLDWWRLRPSYSFLQMQLHTRGGSSDTTSEADEGKSPHHQVSLRSSMDLPHNISLDLMGRYVDHLPAINVPSYITFDARLAWQINRHWEIAIVGKNLVESRHMEFRRSFINTPPGEIPRSVYAKVTFQF